MAEFAIAEHDDGLAGFGVFNPRPIRGAEAGGKVRPGFREEMCMNVYGGHVIGRDYLGAGLPG